MSGRMLVTGATGSLGRRVFTLAEAAGWDVVGTSRTASAHEQLDITNRAAVESLLRRVDPAVVIHTAVGRERGDWKTTADGSAHVAAAAKGARLVHVSSEAVFSGTAVHYDESALPDPVTVYGAAKAAAETAVRAIAPAAAMVRTSLILGDGNGGQERLTHDLVAGRVSGALFDDQIRKPIHVDDLSDALLELAGNDYHGVLNVAGADAIDRYSLGVLVARRDGLDPAAIPRQASPPSLPRDIRLDITQATKLLRVRLRGVHEFVT